MIGFLREQKRLDAAASPRLIMLLGSRKIGHAPTSLQITAVWTTIQQSLSCQNAADAWLCSASLGRRASHPYDVDGFIVRPVYFSKQAFYENPQSLSVRFLDAGSNPQTTEPPAKILPAASPRPGF